MPSLNGARDDGKRKPKDKGSGKSDASSSSSPSVAAGPQAAGTDGASEPVGKPCGDKGLSCSTCEKDLQASAALLQHEWQGKLWVTCFDCWVPENLISKCEASWKKLRKASWMSRCDNAKSHLRGIEMSKQFIKCDREEDESVRAWKRRSIAKVASFVAVFAKGFLKASVEDQAKIEAAFDMWAKEKERVGSNPEASATPLNVCGNILPHEASQMASEFIAGISEWYLCRNIVRSWTQDPPPVAAGPQTVGTGGGSSSSSVAAGPQTAGTGGGRSKKGEWREVVEPCGYFSAAQFWATTDRTFKGGHYRCPRCGKQYQPWVFGAGAKTIPANKLLTIETEGDEVDYWKKANPSVAAGLQTVGTEGNAVLYIPFWWPQTAETGLQDRLKEIFLGVSAELADTPCHDLPQLIADLALQKQVQKSWWVKGGMGELAKQEIEKVNTSSTKEHYFTEHLQEDFIQSRFIYEDGQEVWDQEKLAKVWGTVRLAIKAARRAA